MPQARRTAFARLDGRPRQCGCVCAGARRRQGNVQADAHGCPGCPACPHPAIIGSVDVLTNNLPSLRADDFGTHAACCNTNTWVATKGAQTVFINTKAAGRSGGGVQWGKTCVLRALRHRIPAAGFRLTYCCNATLGRRDSHRQLCHAVGLSPVATAGSLFYALSRHVEQSAAERVHPVCRHPSRASRYPVVRRSRSSASPISPHRMCPVLHSSTALTG